jgi:hypothetical protein
VSPLGVLHHHLRWLPTTTCNNHGTGDGSMTTAEPTAAVVAPAATPPPSPLMATTTTPCGPSTLTPRLAPFRCGLVLRGGGLTSSSLSRRPCWSMLSPTVFLHSRMTRPLHWPWRLHLQWHGHYGQTLALSSTIFLRSRSVQSSCRPWRLHLRWRGHHG